MSSRSILLHALLVLTILVPGLAPASASSLVIDPQRQLDYAEQLYSDGQFLRAAEEYERFAFFFNTSPERRRALFKAARAFLQAGDNSAALKRFNDLTQSETLDDVAVDAYFLAAECHVHSGNPNLAVLEMQKLITRSSDIALRDRAYLRIAWIHIDQMDFSGAQNVLQRISPEGRLDLKIDALASQLTSGDEISQKSPMLAGTLSIFPGAGQFYCGRYQDALAALVVNGGLFMAAWESFDHDLDALGALLTIAGLGFYTANIYGAVTDAHKYNRARKQDFVDQLKQQVSLNISAGQRQHAGEKSEAVLVAIRFNF